MINHKDVFTFLDHFVEYLKSKFSLKKLLDRHFLQGLELCLLNFITLIGINLVLNFWFNPNFLVEVLATFLLIIIVIFIFECKEISILAMIWWGIRFWGTSWFMQVINPNTGLSDPFLDWIVDGLLLLWLFTNLYFETFISFRDHCPSFLELYLWGRRWINNWFLHLLLKRFLLLSRIRTRSINRFMNSRFLGVLWWFNCMSFLISFFFFHILSL